jgi:uncharacterized repeat protein (TIGR03803 family)
MCLFLLSCSVLAAIPGFAQDVLWGMTSELGPTGAGMAFSISSTGADFTVRKAFANAPANPVGSLVEGRDGYFYGVSQYQQGDYTGFNFGTVFKVSPTGTLTVLKTFDYAEGAYPYGSLVLGRDGDFYGMTSAGGIYSYGTIFKISPAGTFTVLTSFTDATGTSPWGSLVQGSDGDFYGLTSNGGSNGNGTIFKMNPTGTLAVLHDFDYANGAHPQGSLVQGSDGDFYGLTSSGGSNGAGTIFKITASGAFAVLQHFDYAEGASPWGSLVQAHDGDFYGMTHQGGMYYSGTIFKISPTGTFTVLSHLSHDAGTNPLGSLVLGSDGDLYGMASSGGRYGRGTVFKTSPTGTVTVLKGFDQFDGQYPMGSLVQGSDGDFYGLTYLGGNNGYSGNGTIFKISPAGTHTVLSRFEPSDGAYPQGSLVQGRDKNFYGMTLRGGSSSQGTIFKLTPSGTSTLLKSFTGTDGAAPRGSLVQGTDGDFYGMTVEGGSTGRGTIFKVSSAGRHTVLHHFTGVSGASPYGSLVQGRDGNFYGMTFEGGSSGQGTVFRITPAGVHTVLRNLTGADGTNPQGSLVQGTDGDFYGMTQRGGSNGAGTIFKMNPAGAYTVLKDFEYYEMGSTYGSLVQARDGDFYGMTTHGGYWGSGTVFKISPDGTHTILHDFHYFEGGAKPQGSLVEGTNGDLYGMTMQGGHQGGGTVFRISFTSGYTLLKSFDYFEGMMPPGSLVVDKLNCTPLVLTVPENITVDNGPDICGASVTLTASVSGTPAPDITYKVGDAAIASTHYFPVGTTTVTALAFNGCGQVAKNFTVTVLDKMPPGPQLTVLPDLTGECAVKITQVPQAGDYCGETITATTTDPLEYTAQGTYTVTWTYRDAGGNAATQTQRVVVKDRTAPVPVLAALPDATGECSVTATAPRATDHCAGSLTATTTDPTTYAAQGTYVIRWRYDDGRGNVTEQPQTVVVKDVTAPVLTAPASLTLANDPGQCGRALANLSLGTPVASDGCGAVRPATHDAPAFFPAGTTTVTWTVEDAAGNASTATQRVTITNADPVLGMVAAPVAPVAIHTPVPARATFRDDNLTEATWDWGNGTTAGTIDRANGTITGSRTYSTPGVHTVTLTVTDACGKTAASTFRYVVVYDPNGGFVTGGGSIHSPANAYAPDPAATGRAQFGFVSKYQKGATQPTGNTNFEFRGAGLEFNSTAYEWLVVSGPQAQFKGAGTLNGAPGYKFILTAGDGQAAGGAGTDRLRIKIWKEGETVPVYDNQRGAADDAVVATALAEGSILVHDDRSKAREGAEVRAEAPGAAATLSGFPNPFTGKTTIAFTLGREEAYSLAVYDLNGRLIATLGAAKADLGAAKADLGAAKAEAGRVNRVVWEARTAPAGMYFVRLTTRSGVQHLKLVLR